MYSIGVHSPKMKFDRALDSSECDIDRLAGGHTPRKVRNRRSPIAVRILVDTHEIANGLHRRVPLRCACLITIQTDNWIGMSCAEPSTLRRPVHREPALRRRTVAEIEIDEGLIRNLQLLRELLEVRDRPLIESNRMLKNGRKQGCRLA
jgi:hypothetical protein